MPLNVGVRFETVGDRVVLSAAQWNAIAAVLASLAELQPEPLRSELLGKLAEGGITAEKF